MSRASSRSSRSARSSGISPLDVCPTPWRGHCGLASKTVRPIKRVSTAACTTGTRRFEIQGRLELRAELHDQQLPEVRLHLVVAGPLPARCRRRSIVDWLVTGFALADFRSYASLDLAVDARLVVLTGDNGAGKTNLLEALSLLAPGRGLRRAELRDCARSNGGGGFAISVEFETQNGGVQLGTGIEPQTNAPLLRKYRIDRAPARSIRGFSDHVRVVWLTPAMDGPFMGPAGDRRRFLDRLVLAIDADHGTRVASLERALRNRNRLLEEGPGADRAWLDAIEWEAAELATAVAAARMRPCRGLRRSLRRRGIKRRPFHGRISPWRAKSSAWWGPARRWKPRTFIVAFCAATGPAMRPRGAP